MTPREQTNGCSPTPVHFSYEQFFTDMDMMFTDAHHGQTENPCPFIHTKNTAIYDYTVGQSLSVIVKRARTHLHSYSIFTFELLCRQDLLMERVGTAHGGGEASPSPWAMYSPTTHTIPRCFFREIYISSFVYTSVPMPGSQSWGMLLFFRLCIVYVI